MAQQYSPDKLRKALQAVAITSDDKVDLSQFAMPPVKESDASMAQYLNGKLFGYSGTKASDATAAMTTTQLRQIDAERERSALTRVFDWMSAPMYGVQNTIADVAELVRGENSFGDTVGDIGNNLGSAVAGFVKPAAEIAMLPGVELPGIEDKFDDTVGQYIDDHNIQHHGTGRISGSRLLEDIGGWEPDSTGGRIGKAIAGFGVDVATDPLTYLTVGAVPAIKAAVRGPKIIDDIVDAANATDKLDQAAAGLPVSSPPVTSGNPAPFVRPQPEINVPTTVENIRDIKRPNTQVGPIKIGDNNATVGVDSSSSAGRAGSDLSGEGSWGLTPVQEAVLRANVGGISPETARTARMTQLSHKRWYEDLHEVPVTGSPVKNLKPQVARAGQNSIDDAVVGEPRELTRPEFRQIFEESQAAYLAQGGKLSSADPKYFAKGIEDALIERGFILPADAPISTFLKGGGNLKDYTKGKPLKEMPDFYPRAKEAKTAAAAASTKNLEGIDVSNVIEDIARGRIPRSADKFLPATGAAKSVAESIADQAWDAVLAAGGKRGTTLNAPNQANMFERMQRQARKTLGKGANKQAVRARAIELMRAGEDHMIAKGIAPVVWGNASLRLTDVLAEVSTEALDGYIPQIMKAFKQNDATLITNPEVRTIVERAMAGRQLDVSAVANAHLDKFNTQVKDLWDNMTPAAAERRAGQLKARMDDELRALGVSPDEANAIKALARSRYIDPEEFGKVPFEDFHKAVHTSLRTDKATGDISPRLASALTKVIDEVLEESGEVYNTYKTLGTGKTVSKANASKVMQSSLNMDNMDSLLTRMTTWYGRGPEWHTWKNGLGYAEKVAMTRAKWFRDINARYSREEQIAAWGAVTGRLGDLGAEGLVDGRKVIEGIQDSNQRDLALKLFDYLDWTIGHKSAWANKTPNALDGVTATKSAMTMADVDRQLKAIRSPLSFKELNKAKKGKDNDWLAAIMDIEPWESYRKTPASLLLDLDRAMTRTHMNYAMIDDFVGRMGRREGEKGFNGFVHSSKIQHTRVPEDMRFEPQVAKEFNRLLTELDKAPWAPGNKASRAYFTALRHWKSGVTIYSPSHHVRNSVGDAWLMWMDGVNNPRVFRDAQKLMWAHRANYKGALKVDENGNPPELDKVMGLISRNDYSAMASQPGTTIITRRGVDLNADDIYRAADERGLFATADQLEDIIGGSMFREGPDGKRGIPKPLGGRGHNVAATVTEYREHYFRSAHFIDVVRKGITPSVAAAYKAAKTPEARRKVLDPIYNDAAKRVRKWHPDGRDLTDFEQRWGRGLVPFYSWQRKSIPLFIQAMVESPQNIAKMTAIPKANFAVQEAMGIEAPSYADPFPTTDLFPDWIRTGGMGPIGDVEMGGLPGLIGNLGRQGVDNSGEQYGMTIINPGNPFQDFIKDFGGMPSQDQNAGGLLKTVMDQSTPIFQWASAIQSGEKTTGAPIKQEEGGDGWGEYALSQVPIASHLQRWFGVGKEEKPTVENGPINSQALLNYLTGAGILGTGMYNKSAEFNQRDYLRRMAEQQ
jgi:hypothetical protein